MTFSDSSSDSDNDSTLKSSSYLTRVKRAKLSIIARLLSESIDKFDRVESTSIAKNNSIQNVTQFLPAIVYQHTMSTKRSLGGSTPGRRYITRDRESRHELIIKDYFMGENSKYSDDIFRRRFRMDVNLFNYIFQNICYHDDYFTQKYDAIGRAGLSPLQKMLAAIRILAYGVPADSLDEYVQIGESTAIESLLRFCDAIIEIFEMRYLRKPNDEDIARLLKENEARGFPGMLGSLDCMHWHWTNCPKAWHGMYTNGFKKVPTLILEAVASKSLWFWHAFFGMAGTNNDITVLDRSPLFDDIINGNAPLCNFKVRGHEYNMGYYLSDDIYPPYATLIQTISEPLNAREKLFAKQQESVRKDVERAFGVLQKRWHIVKGPARLWKASNLGKIMKTCIILHNMIIESEHEQGLDPENWQPSETENWSDANVERNHQLLLDAMIGRLEQVRDVTMNNNLKRDLIDHLWEVSGDD